MRKEKPVNNPWIKKPLSTQRGPPTTYVYDKEQNCFFFISLTGSKHKITQATVIANGVRDLCVRNDMRIRRKPETKQEDIYYIPKGDILWLNIEPPFKGNCTIIQDVGDDPENMKCFVKALLKTGRVGEEGKDYVMYGGDNYGQKQGEVE